MATNKYHWTTEEIVDFIKKYYGVKLHWWQKLELWWFRLRNKNNTYYLFGDLLWGISYK